MNNAILLQQVWPLEVYPGDYRPHIELTRKHNEEYCEKWGWDYEPLIGTLSEKYADINNGAWIKVEMIKNALAKGYDYVMWLDADALIYDTDTDCRDAFVNGIGVCWMRIPQLDHWNTGVMYVKNLPQVLEFIDEWLSKFPGSQQWREQGIFNQMAMQSRIVQTISDRWNATMNYNLVPDAVVLGYHGNGDAAMRLEMMTRTLQQKAQGGSKSSEV